MSFKEVLIQLDKAQVERWSDALLEVGALSVNAQDADADSLDEQPLYGEPGTIPTVSAWTRTDLAILFNQDDDPLQLLTQAAQALESAVPAFSVNTIDDQDWVQLTQSQYEPIPIGKRLMISPSWHGSTDADRIHIIVDPGLAFGTGSHPTTHLCLNWLEDHIQSNQRVIDYGCGSGILAIAAAKLGALDIIGIDIDPQAIIATQSNAQINQVSIKAQLASDAMPSAADVVVANILSSPLKLLAPLLSNLVKPGGWLVLSGVLERQIDEVSQAYLPAQNAKPKTEAGLALQVFAVKDGWACLVARKPA
jgi:ribosomal protein L11 methyltransferase